MEDELKRIRGQVFSLGRELARWREGMMRYHAAVQTVLGIFEKADIALAALNPKEELALRYLRHKALFTPIPDPRDL